MSKAKLVVGLAVVTLAGMTGWQVGLSEWANLQFQDDLRDLSAMMGANIGMAAPQTDEDLRKAVIRRAYQHGITVAPSQVTVRRTGSAESPVLYLAADYDVTVSLPGYSFPLHFAPSSTKRSF
jgi:hypothetical protein